MYDNFVVRLNNIIIGEISSQNGGLQPLKFHECLARSKHKSMLVVQPNTVEEILFILPIMP